MAKKKERNNGANLGFEATLWEQKMKRLTATLKEQCAQTTKLDKAIWTNLKELGYG